MSDELRAVRDRVDAELARFFREKRERTARLSPELSPVVAAAEVLTLRGGKRFRPALAVAGFASVAPIETLDPLIEAACAFELLQTYLLIQDDWMDEDDTRRGGRSVHALLRDELGDPHRAASVAILASDLSCAWAYEVLSRANFSPPTLLRALSAFHQMIEEVVLGQYLDVSGSADTESVHALKTAGYTVRWPLAIGAILGGASDAVLEALDRYARPVGIAFQMRDDLLGTFGDPAVTGKPAGSDLRAGKKTAVIAEARASLAPAAWVRVEAVLGRRDASDEEVAMVRGLLEAEGVRSRVEARLDARIEEAIAGLEGQGLRAEGVAWLSKLGRMIGSRSA